jgi:Sucrase/ferredoxin-like
MRLIKVVNQAIFGGRATSSGESGFYSFVFLLTLISLAHFLIEYLFSSIIFKMRSHPTILKAFRSLARYRAATGDDSGVKITAYDSLEEDKKPRFSTQKSEEGDDSCDLFIFPAGLRYNSLPVSLLDAVVTQGIRGSGSGETSSSDKKLPKLPAAALKAQEPTDSLNGKKLYLFVCCHGSRDARCGVLGTALARQLIKLVKERQLEDLVEIYSTSHIGGHKYAGNVVVYSNGGSHPADGDWYGGVHAEHAMVFLDSLINMEIGVDGGAEDPLLREFWRGRVGLNKGEQIELWESGGAVDSAAESEEEEEGER